MMTYNELENKVFDWGVDRGIVQNGKPMGQALKALEEVGELISAIHHCHENDVRDAIGDVLVCLIMCAATMDMDVVECLEQAYNEIKDRKGFLRQDGVFVKQP